MTSFRASLRRAARPGVNQSTSSGWKGEQATPGASASGSGTIRTLTVVDAPHAALTSELGKTVAEALYGDDHEAPDPVLEGLLRARPGDEQADPADVLLAMIGRPDWHAQAACRGVPTNLFFPRRGERTDEARHLCATCPVTADCLAEALAIAERDDDGFRAGMSAQKRRRLRRSSAA